MDHPFDQNAEAFRAYLIHLREKLDLTQAKMADALGMSLRAYSDLETGKSAVRLIHTLAAERLTLRAGAAGSPAAMAESVKRDVRSVAAMP